MLTLIIWSGFIAVIDLWLFLKYLWFRKLVWTNGYFLGILSSLSFLPGKFWPQRLSGEICIEKSSEILEAEFDATFILSTSWDYPVNSCECICQIAGVLRDVKQVSPEVNWSPCKDYFCPIHCWYTLLIQIMERKAPERPVQSSGVEFCSILPASMNECPHIFILTKHLTSTLVKGV